MFLFMLIDMPYVVLRMYCLVAEENARVHAERDTSE